MTNSTSFHSLPGFVNAFSSTCYTDRAQAGQVLAQILLSRSPLPHPLILALPRGGVPVACEIATAMLMPLDIFLVRKFSLSKRPEAIVGTVASGGVHFLDFPKTKHGRAFSETQDLGPEMERTVEREHEELSRRERRYRQARSPEPIAGRSVIVVDDGLTTGETMRAAVRALRLRNPASITVAVPVASAEASAALERDADGLVCARTPETLLSVARWYRDYSPVLDGEIRNLLASHALRTHPRAFHA